MITSNRAAPEVLSVGTARLVLTQSENATHDVDAESIRFFSSGKNLKSK